MEGVLWFSSRSRLDWLEGDVTGVGAILICGFQLGLVGKMEGTRNERNPLRPQIPPAWGWCKRLATLTSCAKTIPNKSGSKSLEPVTSQHEAADCPRTNVPPFRLKDSQEKQTRPQPERNLRRTSFSCIDILKLCPFRLRCLMTFRGALGNSLFQGLAW